MLIADIVVLTVIILCFSSSLRCQKSRLARDMSGQSWQAHGALHEQCPSSQAHFSASSWLLDWRRCKTTHSAQAHPFLNSECQSSTAGEWFEKKLLLKGMSVNSRTRLFFSPHLSQGQVSKGTSAEFRAISATASRRTSKFPLGSAHNASRAARHSAMADATTPCGSRIRNSSEAALRAASASGW
eukprot:TRINITY_DN30296_c0_g1_i3.p1 TRINITY_DN30296_c0_g1~~TRINITY_DN30296_c0_g1_i3.p1  ORF type:complete len:185 (+),score=11.44 TRINITY_DN30296_c0_g1_i3:213-767(+)